MRAPSWTVPEAAAGSMGSGPRPCVATTVGTSGGAGVAGGCSSVTSGVGGLCQFRAGDGSGDAVRCGRQFGAVSTGAGSAWAPRSVLPNARELRLQRWAPALGAVRSESARALAPARAVSELGVWLRRGLRRGLSRSAGSVASGDGLRRGLRRGVRLRGLGRRHPVSTPTGSRQRSAARWTTPARLGRCVRHPRIQVPG